MSQRPDPLEAELEVLLDAERAAVPPAHALDSVWSRLSLSVAVGASSLQYSSRQTWIASHAKALIAIAFVAGGAAGAELHALLPRTPQAHRVSPEPPAGSATALPLEPPTPPAPPSIALPTAAAVNAGRPAPRAAPTSSLLAERRILDDARTALVENDAVRGLELLDEHSRRFAHPLLAEEREALAIQAIAMQGRYDDARARAAHFRAAWPSSLFLPAVEATLASIP